MSELVELLVNMATGVWLPWLVLHIDGRRSASKRSLGGWNPATRAAALVFFGPLCLPAYFWITRRRASAVLLGVGLAVAVVAVQSLLILAIEAIPGASP